MALQVHKKLYHEIRYFFLRRLPTCREIVPLISQSMDTRLGWRFRIKIKLHLWICVWCEWYLRQLHLISDSARARSKKIDNGEFNITLSPEARTRIKQAISEQTKKTDQN